jgi:hypothetical protein
MSLSLKSLIAASVGVALLASPVAVRADAYKPGEFLLLDLQKAVLSPKLLGPAASFERVQIEAKADAKNEIDAAADRPRTAAQKAVPVVKPSRVAAKPPARSRVVRKRSDPMNANAADTRVQVWPCRTGGICNWQKK